jgi:DNA polymerase II small subunit
LQLEEKEKEIVEYASRKNAFIDESALEILIKQEDFSGLIDQIMEDGVFFINREAVEKKVLAGQMPDAGQKTCIVQSPGFRSLAKESGSKIKVLKGHDVTGQSKSEGKVENFLGYFRRKFELLSRILKQRQGFSPRPVSSLKALPKGRPVDVIGMVFRKWVTKNGHVGIQLEDLEGQCIALVLKDDVNLVNVAERILADSVIGIKAVKWNEDLLIVKEVFWPDLPIRQKNPVESEFFIASTSDFHIGSKLFLEKECNSFLSWLNGRIGQEKEREKAGRVKYLVISGDNVDGVGIYPNQFEELAIKDIYRQYEHFSDLVLQIPEYIEVIICPGQHDAVRWGDPQPAVPKDFLPELSKAKNVHLVGSPSWFEIEGLKAMVYHGAALHDLIGSVSFLNAEHPEQAMIEALKKRDIMSTYGLKQPYVPEKEDYLVIQEQPDLVYIGDMHHNAYGNYRGTTVINSGTWQSRTEYQVKQGHVPTPGIVPVFEISTGKISEKRFMQQEAFV